MVFVDILVGVEGRRSGRADAKKRDSRKKLVRSLHQVDAMELSMDLVSTMSSF